MLDIEVGFAGQSSKETRWVYDAKRSKMHYIETESERAARTQREERARAARKEREQWEAIRRRCKQREQKAVDERRDKDRRANALQGRIARLRSKVAADKTDTSAKAELSMARTQLFWVENAL